MGFFFDDFFEFVVARCAVAGGRGTSWSKYVITDTWNCAIAPRPFGGRREMAMSPHRCALPFSLHGDFSLVHVAQSVPQVREVPNGLFSTLTCHRDDTGASGRRVSFKLPGWLSSFAKSSTSKWNTARKGAECHCSQRVMVPWRHFQAMRPSVSRRGGQSPRYREYARYWWTYQRYRGNAGTKVSSHKRALLPQGRPTPKLVGD